jgi:hypothetical protein
MRHIRGVSHESVKHRNTGKTMNPRTTSKCLRISAFFAILASLGGCKKEEDKYFVSVSASDYALTDDGSDVSTVAATILDQNGNPPAIGSKVQLLVLSGAARINFSDSPVAQSFTDLSEAPISR